MKKIVSIIIFVLIACMIAPGALAAYPQHDDAYIYDEIGALSDEAKTEIKSENDQLFVAKGMRIGVCIVDNTGDIPAETYASGVYGEWELNGVLLLIVKSTNYAYAVPSEALGSIFTEDKIKSLIQNIKSPDNEEEFSAEVAASVKSMATTVKQEYEPGQKTTEKKEKSTFAKVVGTILKIILVVAIILGIGYVILIVLERRQARKRREYLEERRRRMAQSGRGSYYSAGGGAPRQQGDPRRAGGGYPSQTGYGQQSGYGQQTGYGQRAGYGRQAGYSQQNAGQTRSSGDRFVYPDSGDGYAASDRNRAAVPQRNAQNVRRPVARGSASDFEREYFSRPDDSYDKDATREFKTDNYND